MTNYQMPKGVEHDSLILAVLQAVTGMTNYQMPKGVEHISKGESCTKTHHMTNYQMPKGVEH